MARERSRNAAATTRAGILALGLALWTMAIAAYILFLQRLDIMAAMYAGLGASLPLPLRVHVVSTRYFARLILPLVTVAALWLWRRDPYGLGAAKLVSASGLVAIVWVVAGLLLGLHTTAFDLISASS